MSQWLHWFLDKARMSLYWERKFPLWALVSRSGWGGKTGKGEAASSRQRDGRLWIHGTSSLLDYSLTYFVGTIISDAFYGANFTKQNHLLKISFRSLARWQHMGRIHAISLSTDALASRNCTWTNLFRTFGGSHYQARSISLGIRAKPMTIFRLFYQTAL